MWASVRQSVTKMTRDSFLFMKMKNANTASTEYLQIQTLHLSPPGLFKCLGIGISPLSFTLQTFSFYLSLHYYCSPAVLNQICHDNTKSRISSTDTYWLFSADLNLEGRQHTLGGVIYMDEPGLITPAFREYVKECFLFVISSASFGFIQICLPFPVT